MSQTEQFDAAYLNDRMVNGFIAGRNVPERIERAFRHTLRHNFLPGHDLEKAYLDDAVVTAWGEDGQEAVSSSSQPSLMALMLAELDVQPGHRVLEIGTGTGYNAALLAVLAGSPSNVYSVDISAEYSAQARSNLEAQGTIGVNVIVADGWHGWPDGAPYDRIIVTAGSYDVAPAWFDQLMDGGRIVMPWDYRAMTFVKHGERLNLVSHSFCGFMRMRGEFDWQADVVEELGEPDDPSNRTEVPLEGLPSEIAIRWDDLAFFLALYIWPRRAMSSWLGDNPDVKFVMVTHREFRRVIFVRSDGRWRIDAAAGDDLVSTVSDLVHHWFDEGMPGPERLRMTAMRRKEDGYEAKMLNVISRKWFDYAVSWDANRAV